MERYIRQLFSLRKRKSAAISIIESRFVNLFPRQTPPVGRYIQISARSIARRHSANLNTKLRKESFGFFLSKLPHHLIPQRRLANLLLVTGRSSHPASIGPPSQPISGAEDSFSASVQHVCVNL